MDYEEIISILLNSSEKPEREWVTSIVESHPTFIVPLLLMLKRSGADIDSETLTQMQASVVLNCADPTALTDYIDPTGAGWATFYPPVTPHEITTEETIDDFLLTFGHASTPEEDALMERLIFNPRPADYFAGTDEPYDPTDPLALPPELMPKDDEDTSPSDTEQRHEGQGREAANSHQSETNADSISKEETEIKEPQAGESKTEKTDKKPDATHQKPKEEKEASGQTSQPDESLLMESLAKIFIKQRRYERAFEIISKLSLKYPEKSVYFADQLRFLQKLIINQQYQAK